MVGVPRYPFKVRSEPLLSEKSGQNDVESLLQAKKIFYHKEFPPLSGDVDLSGIMGTKICASFSLVRRAPCTKI